MALQVGLVLPSGCTFRTPGVIVRRGTDFGVRRNDKSIHADRMDREGIAETDMQQPEQAVCTSFIKLLALGGVDFNQFRFLCRKISGAGHQRGVMAAGGASGAAGVAAEVPGIPDLATDKAPASGPGHAGMTGGHAPKDC